MRHRAIRCSAAFLACVCCCLGHSAASSTADVLDCGVLEMDTFGGGECLLFNRAYHELLWLDDYGGFSAGDTVLVLGTRDDTHHLLCGTDRSGVRVQTIQPCRGFDFGCGTLNYDEEPCHWFHSWRYGDFMLDSWGGYEVGDTVRVYGGMNYDAISWCAARCCLAADSVVVCPDSLTVASPTTWGRLKALFR